MADRFLDLRDEDKRDLFVGLQDKMINSGMFREDPPSFEDIMGRMRELESRINMSVGPRKNHAEIPFHDSSSGEEDESSALVFPDFTDKPKAPEPGM